MQTGPPSPIHTGGYMQGDEQGPTWGCRKQAAADPWEGRYWGSRG